MKAEYTPTSFRLRALLATAAIVLSTAILGLVAGLADHYSDQVYLANAAQPTVVAAR